MSRVLQGELSSHPGGHFCRQRTDEQELKCVSVHVRLFSTCNGGILSAFLRLSSLVPLPGLRGVLCPGDYRGREFGCCSAYLSRNLKLDSSCFSSPRSP